MNKLTNIALFIFRVSISAFMLFGHGVSKLSRLFSGDEIKFYDPFGIGPTFSLSLAVFAEFIAALLIIIGLFTRLSSFSLIITMFVAGFIYHADDPFSGKEKALLYFVSYIFLFLAGPGKYGLQTLFESKFKNIKPVWRFIFS